MALIRAKNIIEESRILFFINGVVGLRPLRICCKWFPGYLYVAIVLIIYYVLYALTMSDSLAFYDAMSAYTKFWKTRQLQIYSNFIFITLMIVSSVIGSDKIQKLYVDLNFVDEKLKLLNVRLNHFKSTKLEIIHICQVFVVTILFNLIDYFPQIGPDTIEHFYFLWIVNSVPQFINSLVIANFVVVILKIRKRFEAINQLIPNLIILEKNAISSLESEMNNLFRLRLLNKIHEKLFYASTTLNETYGPVLLTSFIVYFLGCCAHLRTVTMTFGEYTNYVDFIVEFLWTLFYLGKFVYVIDACHNVTLQGKLSGRLLYERCTDADHQPLKNEADAMARRVDSRVLQLTACNFFVIDYPTLKMVNTESRTLEIIVALAAYVFFVAQFSINSASTK